ncbi:MAG: hypothetical protein JWM11_2554 [Planctomycetaceae bacterium]|nr:hypothetical protein [Planctomycetaceae bacterium]
MAELSKELWDYFTPAATTFWNWSEDHQAVVWTSGETIVFRPELASLLEALKPIGLPPFDAVLLTIAACRSSAATTLCQLPDRLNFDQFPMQHSLTEQLGNVLGKLRVICSLPADLRGSMDGKQAILTLVAENGSPLTTPELAGNCVEWLRQGYRIDYGPKLTPQLRSTIAWSILFRGLQDGLASVNEVAVRLRMRTGLEPADLPQPVPLELPDPVPLPYSVRDLLQELEQDENHSGLYRLVKRVLSIVTLPRPVSAPSDQPLGGVSDISNRGPFDRLLLSELAHDVDVLMTRVALNEALYIRREVPPTIPPRNRLVLLDAGIRMWGLPRLYAAAVSLALAATQHESVTTRIFRAENQTVIPVDLSSREEFLEHLEVLELPAHPGRALPAFVNEAEGTAADFVIVTGEDVLADPEFRLCLSEHKQQIPELYLVIVNRIGSLRLIHRTRQGDRILKEALLDLEQILQIQPKTKLALRDHTIPVDLPAIFYIRPFPLLLCHKFDKNNSGDLALPDHPDALLTITSDRRLMLWSSKQAWAQQLYDRVPRGKLVWNSARPDEFGRIRVLVGDLEQGQLSLVIADLSGSGEVVALTVPAGRILDVFESAGVLHLVLANQTLLLAVENGRRLASAEHKHEFKWIRNRFYYSGLGCYVLAFNGKNAVWQMVLPAEVIEPLMIKSLFDCQACSAPVAFTQSNEFIITGSFDRIDFQWIYTSTKSFNTSETDITQTTTPEALGRGSNYRVTEISRDGNLVKLAGIAATNKIWHFDLSRRIATEIAPHQLAKISHDASRFSPSGNLRSRFVMVGVHDGKLILMTNKQKFVSLEVDLIGNRLYLAPSVVNRENIKKLVGFSPVSVGDGVGYELKQAYWMDGSRIYLDSRGMLHLRSSDSNFPEITLVLHETQVSGWSNENLVWGDSACIGTGKALIAATDVFKTWLGCFANGYDEHA